METKQIVTKSVDDLTPDEIANLTDADFERLVSEAEGNKGESEDNAQAAPPATTDGKEESQDEPVGILAKDGKSIIPIEVLQKERDRAKNAEQSVAEKDKKLEEAQAELAELRAKAAEQGDFSMEGVMSEEELDALAEELPELAEKIRASQSIVARAQAMIQKQEVDEAQRIAQEAIDSVPKLAYVQSNNPELFKYAISIDDEMQQDPEFANLTLAKRFEKVVEKLEKILGGEIKLPNAKTLQIKEKAHIASLDDIPGGTPPDNDEVMSLANKSPTELAAMMGNMSDAEVDRFLARATKNL